jgi:putative hydrolase of the HAD superfamily
MGQNLGAVAFDLDGTLYPNYRLNLRLIPFILREFPLLMAFGSARDRLRGKKGPREAVLPGEDFYAAQARLMVGYLKIPSVPPLSTSAASRLNSSLALQDKVEQLIYRGWEAHFAKIKLYPHVRETLDDLRRGGLKLALLSDFPPEQKIKHLGLDGGLWDLVLCSEVLGALKPDAVPFQELIRRLDMEPSRILYVGNSVSYDIKGAKAAGCRAALISPRHCPAADFTFFDYRKLGQYVLK